MENAKSTVQSVGEALAVPHAVTPHAPELTITEVAASAGIDRGTAFRLIHTLTDLDDLCARLGEVRARGHAVSDGEDAFGLRTVAAPILWPDGTARAAIGPTVRAARQALEPFVAGAVAPLLRAAGALTGAVRLGEAA